jgi:N-glycosylase/DNA lyase
MHASFSGHVTLLRDAEFSPFHTFSCGQVFRWLPFGNGWLGVAGGRPLMVVGTDAGVELSPCTREDFTGFWEDYFDLKRDMAAIRQALSFDPFVSAGMAYAHGLRILNQDPFETLISFILSANNNMKRIQGIIARLCGRYGAALPFGDIVLHAFPSPEALAGADIAGVEACGAGYRAPYVIGAARALCEGFDLETLRCVPHSEAKSRLLRLPGVGPKVADCVLLFSLSHGCAFPVDVWVSRIMRRLYLGDGASTSSMVNYAALHFGEHAGIAQQCLFHYAREGGLDLKAGKGEPSGDVSPGGPLDTM